MSKPIGRPHKEWLHERLQDPGFAADYLTAAADDPEPGVYLAALRNVAEARGMTAVAKAAGIPRESLYRALSAKGNPRWSTLSAIHGFCMDSALSIARLAASSQLSFRSSLNSGKASNIIFSSSVRWRPFPDLFPLPVLSQYASTLSA